MKNDIVRKENVIDSLHVHKSNLLNYQCCRVIKDTQFNVQSGINTDVTDNHSNNHGVDTITNEKKKTINKPPLIKRTIKQQHIEKTMMVI